MYLQVASVLYQFCSDIIICRDLGHLNIPQNITLVHYIDSIIRSNEQEVTNTLLALVRHTQLESGR